MENKWNNHLFRNIYFVSLASAAATTTHGIALDDDIILDEIIVTATKHSKNLQDIPLAVSAFLGDDLRTRGIESALALTIL